MEEAGSREVAMQKFRRAKPRNPLSYPKADAPFDYDLFEKPTAEYRGCPLWAWNTKLDKEAMIRQIGYLQEMGFGGFHMHVRTGLDTEYMGREFMDIVKTCVDVAEQKGLLACLYDDDRWPSGVAGGKVVAEDHESKAQHILFTSTPYGQGHSAGCSPSSAAACRSENGYLLARYAIRLNPQDGTLESYREINRLPDRRNPLECLESGETIWFAYLETNPPSEWFNGQTYVDTLNPKAIREFIKTTHEKYQECVGDKFGTTVPCIFTDEPQFATKTRLAHAFAKEDLFIPWTKDLPDTFNVKFYDNAVFEKGEGPLIASLPELFWDLPDGKPSRLRYRFHDHVCERFVSAFMDQLGAWCADNGILLNGHMMEEPTLESQTHSLGEAMRCYRNQSLPGIDLLSDMVEYNTAKQASSVARQNGITGCMSELYGCTHWYFTFEGHKGCGDWQAALGVTFRVPHLAWASMAGEAKRDYPASLNYQSPWFREYGYVEDHFARVAVAMTRGQAVTRVAVVHPIESFWLLYGPGNDPKDQLGDREQKFKELTDWLLHGLIDFDFISESLLPDQDVEVKSRQLKVGSCTYDAVIVPNLLTIRSTTLAVLKRFIAAGGKVIVAGCRPRLVDAQPVTDATHVLDSVGISGVPWKRGDILESLEEFRELDVQIAGSTECPETLLYQMRQDGDERFVFICNTNRNSGVDTDIYLRGHWDVELLDTLSGERRLLETRMGDVCERSAYAFTDFCYRFEGCESVLLRLWPSKKEPIIEKMLQYRPESGQNFLVHGDHLRLFGVDLVEEGTRHSGRNVLMLDYAKYYLSGDEDWSHVQEILALNNEILDRLRLPRKGMAWRQPWTISPTDRAPRTRACLEFQFMSDFDVPSATHLAIELPEGATVSLNGTCIALNGTVCFGEVPSKAAGDWFVDEAITTILIPGDVIQCGKNTLQLEFPFGMLTPIERVYLLGDFKVEPARDLGPGTLARAKIGPYDEPPSYTGSPALCQGLPSVDWGDITVQGLPFYVGNLSYRCSFRLLNRSKVTLSVPQFSSPVLTVEWGAENDRKKGHIAFQPRTLDLGILDEGYQNLSITAYGNRYNAFGHIHTPDSMSNCWPDAWRTQGWAWTEEYNVRAIGILKRPHVLITEIDPAVRIDDMTTAERRWIMPFRTSVPVSLSEWAFTGPAGAGSVSGAGLRPSSQAGSSNSGDAQLLTPDVSSSEAASSPSASAWPRFSTPPQSLLELNALEDSSDIDYFVRLGYLIQDARQRLAELWDALGFSEAQRREFPGAFSERHNRTLLAVHEVEILRLHSIREQRGE